MKILVIAASFSSKISGAQRHAFNVVRCLLLHPDISTVQLVVAPWQRELVEAAGLGANGRLSTDIAEMEPEFSQSKSLVLSAASGTRCTAAT